MGDNPRAYWADFMLTLKADSRNLSAFLPFCFSSLLSFSSLLFFSLLSFLSPCFPQLWRSFLRNQGAAGKKQLSIARSWPGFPTSVGEVAAAAAAVSSCEGSSGIIPPPGIPIGISQASGMLESLLRQAGLVLKSIVCEYLPRSDTLIFFTNHGEWWWGRSSDSWDPQLSLRFGLLLDIHVGRSL